MIPRHSRKQPFKPNDRKSESMAPAPPPAKLLLAVMTSAVILLHLSPADASAPGNGVNSTEYIRQSCSATLYPTLCFDSLAGYASAVNGDPVKLALVGTNVSLSDVRSVCNRVSNMSRLRSPAGMERREKEALQDCRETLGNAVHQTVKSVAEVALIPSSNGSDVAWRVSNAQTWMSAALTNEMTCVDGFKSLPGLVKVAVCGRVGRAKQYTSNALALINSLVEKSRS